jgi:hypothetical protein
VTIDWVKPYDGGSSITGYKIYIRKHDGTYDLEVSSCDGSDSAIMAATSCTIPVNTVRIAPFMLAWGSTVEVKVISFNSYGDSVESSVGISNIIIT